MAKNKEIIENLSFEKTIAQIEEIVTDLEKGTLNLDESVEKFEIGMKLSNQCSKMLEQAEKKINILIQKGDNIEEENFNGDEE